MDRTGFEPVTSTMPKGNSLREFYVKNREDYLVYLRDERRVCRHLQRDYVSSLDRKLKDVKTVKELKRNVENEYTESFCKGLRNLFNYMDSEDIMFFNGIPRDYWTRKI
jgi:intergrase/recombinase